MKTIEGYLVTGMKDYDKEILSKLSHLGKLEWFIYRTEVIFWKPIDTILSDRLLPEVFNENQSITLIITNIICLAIEALGNMYSGKTEKECKTLGVSKANFESFVREYMSEEFQHDYGGKKGVDYLRKDFRNGLAHGFVIKDGTIEGPHTNYYMKYNNKFNALTINPWRLYDDLKNAFIKYANAVRDNKDGLLEKFIRRFDRIYGVMGKESKVVDEIGMDDRPYEIYKFACEYSKAAHFLNQQANQLLASLVMAALALELYFKSLYYLEYGFDFKINGRHSHDIHTLFYNLDDKVREEMIANFNGMLKTRNMEDVRILEKEVNFKISLQLIENLKIWGNVFIELRYAYDLKKDRQLPMMFFPEIEKTIQTALYRRKPEWHT